MRRYKELIDRVIANSVQSEEHFWTNPETGETTRCWEWTGKLVASRNGTGRLYPVMTVKVKGKVRNKRVHRAVLEEVKGLRMEEHHVGAHHCNYTPCVHPEHLRRDTQSGNMQQCVREGRHNSNPANDFERLESAA